MIIALLFLLISANSSPCFGTVYVLHNIEVGVVVETFADAVSEFGPELFHLDGYLAVAQPSSACDEVSPPSPLNFSSQQKWAGLVSKPGLLYAKLPFIALIDRGDCDFDKKVYNVQKAGFNGAIVINTRGEEFFPMSGRDFIHRITIPSVMVSKTSGEKLTKYANPHIASEYLVSMVSFYSLPLKYVLLSLLVVVGVSLVVLIFSFGIHLCRLWRHVHRGRLSKRHLRQLLTRRFHKGRDPYETCAICLEDYMDHDRLRLLPCRHAFHMDCIDPWLLQNQRRCPVCNQAVELLGAPSVSAADDALSEPMIEPFYARLLPFARVGSIVRTRVARLFPQRHRVAPGDSNTRSVSQHSSTEDEETPLLVENEHVTIEDSTAQHNLGPQSVNQIHEVILRNPTPTLVESVLVTTAPAVTMTDLTAQSRYNQLLLDDEPLLSLDSPQSGLPHANDPSSYVLNEPGVVVTSKQFDETPTACGQSDSNQTNITGARPHKPNIQNLTGDDALLTDVAPTDH